MNPEETILIDGHTVVVWVDAFRKYWVELESIEEVFRDRRCLALSSRLGEGTVWTTYGLPPRDTALVALNIVWTTLSHWANRGYPELRPAMDDINRFYGKHYAESTGVVFSGSRKPAAVLVELVKSGVIQ
jgi:hypothetical protein